MQMQNCHHCGYDLTGLSAQGNCPECGNDFNVQSKYRPPSPLHPVVRYIKVICFSVIAAVIFLIGAALSMTADRPLGGLLLTLVITALPAMGAWVYWLEARREEKGDA